MNVERLSQLFAQAEELDTGCEFDKVIEVAKEILKLDGSNVRALLLGAGSLVSKGDESSEQEAREWYQKAIELEPSEGYDKYFALAQLSVGNEAIDLYEKGIRLLDSEITRLNKGDEKDKLKQERVEAIRSLTEVLISDMNGAIYLNKARDLILKLLKDDANQFNSYDIFLLAQVYDKFGSKFKMEIQDLCKACTRRLLTEEADDQPEEKLGDFLSKFASFCLDYGFLHFAKHVINRLGLVGGKSPDYLSLKAVCYRLKCDEMLKKCHYYADSCLELIEDLEDEDETVETETKDTKETMEEIKKTTPVKLPKLFSEKPDENGSASKENDSMEDEDEDSAEDSDDEDEFSVARKPITAKRHQKLLEAEKKRIFELCRIDIGSSETQEMDVEMQ